MSVLNHTPFPAIAFRHYNLAGQLNGVLAVRGTFQLARDGALVIAKEQAPLVLADHYDGPDPHTSELIGQSDLVPFKPGTDITLVGVAYTSDGNPAKTWTCGLSLGSLSKELRVHGPRDWIDRGHADAQRGAVRPHGRGEQEPGRWILGEAQPQREVALSWTRVFGGAPPGPDAPAAPYGANPLGCGRLDGTIPRGIMHLPAPQIEAAEEPTADPAVAYRPHNLAPIPPFWIQRLQYAGTYDEDWLKHRHPLLPQDFDFRFWQCAHPDLIARPWLRGNELFELRNLLHGYPQVYGALPGIRLRMRLPRGQAMGVSELVLDGVHFDLRPRVWRVFLTWRTSFPWSDGAGRPELLANRALTPGVA